MLTFNEKVIEYSDNPSGKTSKPFSMFPERRVSWPHFNHPHGTFFRLLRQTRRHSLLFPMASLSQLRKVQLRRDNGGNLRPQSAEIGVQTRLLPLQVSVCVPWRNVLQRGHVNVLYRYRSVVRIIRFSANSCVLCAANSTVSEPLSAMEMDG